MKRIYILFLTLPVVMSCKKDWLDAKPNQALIDISTVSELQALLDNTNLFNQNQVNLSDLGTDEYYILNDRLPSLSAYNRNIYSWASTDNFYDGAFTLYEWDNPYNSIYTANIVLDKVNRLDVSKENIGELNSVKGTALFFRAFTNFRFAQVFAKPYNKETASRDLGLVVRTEADINIPSKRISVQESYRLIEDDLKQSLAILPLDQQFKTRPSKNAALALLAKVYLAKGEYDSALAYSGASLARSNALMSLDTIKKGTASSFKRFSSEVILHAETAASVLAATSSGSGYADTALIALFEDNDYRKNLFFNKNATGRTYFTGSYTGSFRFFSGLSTNEMYLIRAECLARKGQVADALALVNQLLEKRYVKGKFNAFTTTDQQEALNIILRERRKELCFRACRWTDLRRLNQEDTHKVTLQRKINDQTVTLPPNDPKYTYPIPDSEIRISKIEQNPR